VYYSINVEAFFELGSIEKRGRCVGIAEKVGNGITLKILTEDTLKIIYCSCVCAATNPASINLLADVVDAAPDGMHTDPDVNTVPPQSTISSHHDAADGEHSEFLLPFVDSTDLICKTFLMGSRQVHQYY